MEKSSDIDFRVKIGEELFYSNEVAIRLANSRTIVPFSGFDLSHSKLIDINGVKCFTGDRTRGMLQGSEFYEAYICFYNGTFCFRDDDNTWINFIPLPKSFDRKNFFEKY